MNDAMWIIVPAAGRGERMGSDIPKQYVMLGEQCMLQHTLSRLLPVPDVDGIVVTLSENDDHWPMVEAGADERVHTTIGGATRADSVLAGLRYVLDRAAPSSWVLVHDAARPLVSLSDIRRLVDTVYNSGAIGGILATPVQDTLKSADEYCCIECTVSRNQLWQAQTPQMFRAGELLEALETSRHGEVSGIPVTDESSAMENLGHEPQLVEALQPNLKVTRPADLLVARLLLTHFADQT
ncbi:2-C-methyl-D-erythritol 4-phosphate cytidylyltransferase [Granulosicoccus antarcticus]|uniref:2-C-methyl-D-erythritol 4-phosphate cytidylyltransferase n=1 Tax=Granulosicoccus antarcticus IMCC3135 TaxID=1192854 RepID=A0A2Z2P2N4_9GAMM|nr:2-C-methyl-D-erythritol 4-phosphate cytidylyltransferase [Granulosicoccus antarcticus]ASJ74827.1 2-C-methyl-D-erythritol 4-phosphate cytidylyltransferase [Granulosicoccus antarcticus IMCC3135]